MDRKRVFSLVEVLAVTVIFLSTFLSTALAQTKLRPVDPYPSKITKSGSYVLEKNVAVPSKDANDDAFLITASNVTFDLQGYTISGPGTGTGIGIDAIGTQNVTIQNGFVTGMGGIGIRLGANSIVRNVQILGNGAGDSGDGVECNGSSCLVSNSMLSGNAGAGINFTDATSGYLDNVFQGNGSTILNGTNMGGNICNGSATCP